MTPAREPLGISSRASAQVEDATFHWKVPCQEVGVHAELDEAFGGLQPAPLVLAERRVVVPHRVGAHRRILARVRAGVTLRVGAAGRRVGRGPGGRVASRRVVNRWAGDRRLRMGDLGWMGDLG